jgi:hypothetical protein
MKNFCFILICLLAACQTPQKSTQSVPTTSAKEVNPAAAGFDAAGSDPAAIAIANEVMLAQGGRTAWDNTHFIAWNFFGSRKLNWDKWTGVVTVEWLKKPWKVVVDIDDTTGKVWLNGTEQTQPDTLAKYLDLGKKAWINDSYWLVMPYKLKDSGVTLKSLGKSNTEDGLSADLLQLTFKGVGVTPDNKYHVWVDQNTRLVTQWAFFTKYTDEKPAFVNPWKDYKKYGQIMLSGDRGRGKLEGIEVR